MTDPENLLSKCIIDSIENADFKWDLFFDQWFRKTGTPLYFLFKKNLGVTNTQYVELFSLLTLYNCKLQEGEKESKLLFYSTDHIKTTFSEAMFSLLENYKVGEDQIIHNFSKRYIDVFSATVAVDMFYGSCAVFLPPNISVDIEKVVFDSGYIHSAGKSIFIRNIKKAKKSEFIDSLQQFVAEANLTETIPFVVYSHEDFSAFDKEHSDLMDRGIEQCKLYVEKMSMGSDRLSSIINEVSEIFKGKLFVPSPGDYREEHDFKKGRSLWLISDRSISSGQLRNPGTNRYYVCYEQILKDDSPFYFFDENKPAWKSHTTLPHSLTSALINSVRPLMKGSLICDPFGGTGTTWLEVKRLQLDNRICISDLSSLTTTLLEDNLCFFQMSATDLALLMQNVKACVPTKALQNQTELFTNNSTALDPYQLVYKLIDNLRKEQPDEDQEFNLSSQFVEDFRKYPFLTRVLFYVALRAELRYQGGFKRKSVTFEEAFKKSQKKLLEQMQLFRDLKIEIEGHIKEKGETKSFYIKSLGNYSYKLTPSFLFNGVKKTIHTEVIHSLDARKLEPETCDLIICDPPYGFNTKEDGDELASLYSEFLDKAIAALKPNGQLVLCLPSESFTGKDLPYCTRSDLVSRQILIRAHKQNRLVYSPSKSIPSVGFAPPYYWESEKALRRSILHFRFF